MEAKEQILEHKFCLMFLLFPINIKIIGVETEIRQLTRSNWADDLIFCGR